MLDDRVFLVAGSSRGIGRAIAASLLREGARVCITGRDRDSLDRAQRALGEPDSSMAYAGDLSVPSQIAAVYSSIVEAWGRIDGVVANLGTGSGKIGWDQTSDDWERAMTTNFRASTMLAQAAIPYLSGRGGSIVFIASIAGVEASAAPLPYSAAKAALINYSKNLAREVAALQIRVNCVAPGNVLFAGGSWERRLETNREIAMQMISREVPLGRFGGVDEIADVVAFLSSSRSSFITGSCIVADGGQTRSI